MELAQRYLSPPPIVAVIPLAGPIGSLGGLRRGLNLMALAPVIERAFKLRRLKAVALTINSPGGSAAQSALIFKRIRALAEEKKIPVYGFAEDVAASGGYWLACAADEIFADESSILGSIGVVSAGFGFPDLLRRLGVDRRVHTAGERKMMLDPFRDERPEEVERLKAIQGDIHGTFRAVVRARRGDRLQGSESDLFSGEFWTGRRALELGLIDGIGDLRSVMRARFGERVRLRPVLARRPWWRVGGFRGQASGLADPQDWAGMLLSDVEARLMWNRFGL